MSAAIPEPRPNSRWQYLFVDGRVDSFGVSGCVNHTGGDTGRSVMTTIGGCPAGSIRLATWRRWVAEGRLVELEVTP